MNLFLAIIMVMEHFYKKVSMNVSVPVILINIKITASEQLWHV